MTTATELLLGAGPARQPRAATRTPGEPAFWLLIFGDLLVFSALFTTFAVYRLHEPAVFLRSQPHLHRALALLNAIILLTSSGAVASAVRLYRAGEGGGATRRITLAMACGGAFFLVKATEYLAMVRAGLSPSTNDFYMFYFVCTGVHLLHLTIGMVALLIVRSRLRAPVDAATLMIVECGGLFWHLVDIVWVVIFTTIYLYR